MRETNNSEEMWKSIQKLDDLKALLQDKENWPRILHLWHILNYGIISSGLYSNLEGIRFYGQKAELKDLAETVFEGLLGATKLNDIEISSADAFGECKLTSLLFRSPVSKSLVRLELVKFRGKAIGRLSKVLNGCNLREFVFEPAPDTERLSALLLLNMNPIPELNIRQLRTIKEAFFLKDAMKRWREKKLGYERLSLRGVIPFSKWMNNFVFAEVSRENAEISVKGHPDYLESGKILWADNDPLVTFSLQTGLFETVVSTDITLK